MLPKKNRLTGPEVEQIKMSRRKPISGPYFGLVGVEKGSEPKFGVIVSNKLSKSAVVRNRIRRTVYDAIYPKLNQPAGWYLFLAKKNAVEASREQIEIDIKKLLSFQKTQKIQ